MYFLGPRRRVNLSRFSLIFLLFTDVWFSFMKTMNKLGLAKETCVGIGTDGCSVMSSKVCGAVATIQREIPLAIRCPCNNHSLNLSLARTSSVHSIRNAVGTVKDVVSFFNASAKRNFVMKNFAGKQLQSLCETRWIERHDSLLQFCTELSTIVRALNIISRWDDSDSSSKANTLKVALCNCEFVVSQFSLCDALSLTLPVSKQLQGKQNDFQSARTQINDSISVLKSRRIDFVHFDDIFGSACECMNELDVPIVQPRVSQRQVNRANPPATTPTEYYRRAIYLPLLDAVVTDMQSRFGEETVSNLNELTYFIPSIIAQSAEISLHLTDHLLRRYGCITGEPVYQFKLHGEIALWRQKWVSLTDKTDGFIPQTAAESLAACDKQAFPLIHVFLSILLTLPVSTASAERSFSTLGRLKSWTRSRMSEDRLTGLALLNVHRDIPVSVDKVIDRFAKSKKRSLNFVL